jgi:hypothetical protein
MAQQVRAVVAKAKGEPVTVETIEIPDPGPGEVVVQELPSFLTVPPAYLGWLGASKAVTLDIRIDRM